ncbi:unnamed protein product [Cuscuta epithymum]|uniref:Uncharacterized protein n=1 Tax=Cuscuta epithymum TaxID=186058 RepID=A0AAV0DUV6_9ASTE|nr:unnamed protein product [Cuscuta epithymum]CAH9127965.1 unnamed protein product [Cuscuta epithymum]
MAGEEPILSRIQRLDTVLKQLEGMKGGGGTTQSAKSSTASSTASSGEVAVGQAVALTSSSPDYYFYCSPTIKQGLEKQCRPMKEVVMEAALKGTIIQRLVNVEDRVTELCMHFQRAFEALKISGEAAAVAPAPAQQKQPNKMAPIIAAAPTATSNSAGGEHKKSPKLAHKGGFKQKSPKKGGFRSFVKSCVKTKGKDY